MQRDFFVAVQIPQKGVILSNVILFSRFKLSQPSQLSLAVTEEKKTIAGFEGLAEQLRDQMAIVTKYLEDLQLHLEAHSVAACSDT